MPNVTDVSVVSLARLRPATLVMGVVGVDPRHALAESVGRSVHGHRHNVVADVGRSGHDARATPVASNDIRTEHEQDDDGHQQRTMATNSDSRPRPEPTPIPLELGDPTSIAMSTTCPPSVVADPAFSLVSTSENGRRQPFMCWFHPRRAAMLRLGVSCVPHRKHAISGNPGSLSIGCHA